MQITRTPQRGDDQIAFSADGDAITINDEVYDFSSVAEGEYIENVPCKWVTGLVKREGGEIRLTLIEPYGRPTEEAQNVEA